MNGLNDMVNMSNIMLSTVSNFVDINNNSVNDDNDHCLPYEYSNTTMEACNYVKEFFDQCEGGGYLLWTEYIICTENTPLRMSFIFLSIIYLLFLFFMMTTIADDFFCHSISTIVDHHKISQSIAGVTLMALGNGANDIFSIISSMVNTNNPKAGLAIGTMLGGGAFVTMIVFGSICLVKPFKIAKFATLRDLGIYIIGIGWIAFIMLYDTNLYFWEPAVFLVLYLIYVAIIVFEKFIKEYLTKRQRIEKVNEKIISTVFSLPEIKVNSLTHDIPVLPLRRCISLHAKHQLSKNLLHRKTLSNFNTSHKHHHPINFVDSFAHPLGKEDDQNVVITAFAEDGDESVKPRTVIKVVTLKRIINDLCAALNPLGETFKEEKWYSKILQIIKFPVIVFVKLTVPQGIIWCKTLTLIHCFTMPLTVLFSLNLLSYNIIPGDPGLWVYSFIPSTIMFLLVLFFTSYSVAPVYHKSISGYFGFIVSVSWIYLMSSELVNVIFMLSIVSRLSQEILGLTIMAWSNSIGDFIADTAVARQGFPQMAASAAIGAPLLTMLFGFGTAFFIATLQRKRIDIEMDSVKGLLVIMVATSLITTLVTLFINRFNAKRVHGIILIILYFVFLTLVILADLKVINF